MNHQDNASQASTAELMRRLSDQTTLLVRQEVDLAKAELSLKGKQAGLGAGLFGAAGLLGLYAVGALVAAAVAALSLLVATWLAALILGVLLAAVAGVLALQARNRVRAATPPTPEAMIETTKADIDVIKSRAKEGREHA